MGRHRKVKADFGGNAGPGSVVTLQPGAQGALHVTRNPDGTATMSFTLPSLSADAEAKLANYVGKDLCTIQVAEQPMVGMERDAATGQFTGTLRRKVAPAELKETIKARILKVEDKLDLDKLQATLDQFSQRELVALDYLGNPFNCKMSEEDVKSDLAFSENMWDKMITNEGWIWCRQKLTDFHQGVSLKPTVLSVVVDEVMAVKNKTSPRDQVTTFCLKVAATASRLDTETPTIVNNLYQAAAEVAPVEGAPGQKSALQKLARKWFDKEKAERPVVVGEDGQLREDAE
jgi:hypothetical protein